MAFGRRRFTAVLFVFLLVVASTAVPISRSLQAHKDQGSGGNFHSQDVKETDKDDWVSELERRISMELQDYPGTGANNNHDPRTPGRF